MKNRILELLKDNGGEAIRYLVIGGLTTLLNFAVFTVLVRVYDLENVKWGVTIANCIAIPVSVIFAYVTNKLYVFRTKCGSFRTLLREMFEFFASRAVTMVIEVLGVELFVDVWGMSSTIGKLLIQVIVVVSNYVLSKFIIFRKKST